MIIKIKLMVVSPFMSLEFLNMNINLIFPHLYHQRDDQFPVKLEKLCEFHHIIIRDFVQLLVEKYFPWYYMPIKSTLNSVYEIVIMYCDIFIGK